jgi:predicted nucleic acid-binding Zn ribbon protein
MEYDMWRCANCGNECEDALKSCWSCQSPKAAAQSEAPDTSEGSFCSVCTRLIPTGEAECHCRSEGYVDGPTIAPKKQGRNRDETIRWMQAFLRTLAWLAIVVNAIRLKVLYDMGHEFLDRPGFISTVFEAAYA